MSAILEHSDHRKAGRAVVIVSTMYIFLDQCTLSFDAINLLSLEVRITSQEFNQLLWTAVCLYFVLFIFRLFQSGIFYWPYEVFHKNENSFSTISEYIKHYFLRREHNATQLKARKDAVVRAQYPKVDLVTPPQHQMEEKLEANQEKINKKIKFGNLVKRMADSSLLKYKNVKNFVDIVLLLLVEVGIPVFFFIVAYAAIADTHVCPSFAAYKIY